MTVNNNNNNNNSDNNNGNMNVSNSTTELVKLPYNIHMGMSEIL